MPVTHIQQSVKVLAAFAGGYRQTRPLQLVWRGVRYRLGGVDFLHTTKNGSERIYHFSLSDEAGSACFKLAFYTHSLQWVLEEVDDGA